MFFAPSPRFRIYTKPSHYIEMFLDAMRGALFTGDQKRDLEQVICQKWSLPYSICMPMARTGIYFSLRSLIKPGQEVILSPLTIVDVINMVLCAGGRPVFVDVEPNTCNINPHLIEQNITSNTGAVLITHLHGLACDVETILAICRKHNLPLIEDAAQAFSCKVNGNFIGSFGDVGVFSFGMYKNINSFYGGMVVTHRQDVADHISKQMMALPMMDTSFLMKRVMFALATDISTSPIPFSLFTYWLFRYGFLNDIASINGMVTVDLHPIRYEKIRNELMCHMTPSQARLVLSQLNKVESDNLKRIEAARLYHEGLSSIKQLILPPLKTDGSHIYTYYAFRAPDRKRLLKYALRSNRDFVLSHYHNTASLKIFKDYFRLCPEAEKTAHELLYLPTYPRYPKSEILKNIAVIQDFFREQEI